ncbi:pigment dispersing hormone related peptide precursor 79 - penaeid shrimp (Penaeus sp.) [Penaeus vannamei]|uniref:Pigment dispersing hormone related peptide 79-penaeid shrimp (Penaeus sp.) n=1 Tax=Penaeus vannamei TaxID=6689 RepID=A0A3R7MIN8_PENVA|nr:pigment dispersing hormone related peptide precursor 79 - penaeid shrimp (Penaeus sp.) [Penaeus vannamei]
MSFQHTASGDTLNHFEREIVSELAAQILRVAQGPSAFVAGPHKRNSELINSSWGSQGHERRREEINNECSHLLHTSDHSHDQTRTTKNKNKNFIHHFVVFYHTLLNGRPLRSPSYS